MTIKENHEKSLKEIRKQYKKQRRNELIAFMIVYTFIVFATSMIMYLMAR